MAQTVIDSQIIPEGRLLRTGGWSRWIAWALCITSVLSSLFLLILFQPSYSDSHHSQHGGLFRPVVALACLVFALVAVRKVRSGIILEKDGVVVRSAIGPSRYQWSEINEFQWRPLLIKKALQIQLKNGRRIYVHGFSVRSPDEARRAEKMVAELNRLVTGGSVQFDVRQ
ncbi:MAG: hypothetical protein ACTHNP_13270 [Solirubrobacterales bacterium]